MTKVMNVRAAALPAGRRVRGGGPAFHVGGEPPVAEGAVVPALSSLSGLLAMQETESTAVLDREAYRHGSALMDGLAGLQLALLGRDGTGSLDGLAALTRRTPSAADAGLNALVQALHVRAAIELARRAR